MTNSAVSARAYKPRPRRSGSFIPQGRQKAGAELAMTAELDHVFAGAGYVSLPPNRLPSSPPAAPSAAPVAIVPAAEFEPESPPAPGR